MIETYFYLTIVIDAADPNGVSYWLKVLSSICVIFNFESFELKCILNLSDVSGNDLLGLEFYC